MNRNTNVDPRNHDARTSAGFAAGDVFRTLERHERGCDFNTLRRELPHIEEPVLHQAIGWLMREGKVQIQDGNHIFLD